MRWTPYGFPLLLVACGPAVGLDAEAGTTAQGEAEGADVSLTETSAPGTSGPQTTGMVSDATGTETTGDGDSEGGTSDTTEPEPAGLCGRSADAFVAMVFDGVDSHLIRGDGSLVAIEAPAVGAPAESNLGRQARGSTDGSWAAVVSDWSHFNGGSVDSGYTLRTFDIEGLVAHEESLTSATFELTGVGPQGDLLGYRQTTDTGYEGLYLIPGEPPAVYPGFRPRHGSVPSDVIPGRLPTESSPNPLAWTTLSTGAVAQISPSPLGSRTLLYQGRLVYQADGQIVLADPDGTTTAVDVAAFNPGPNALTWVSASPDWILLEAQAEQPEDSVWVRVSLAEQAAETIEITPPPGFEAMECYGRVPAIEADGAVVMALRDAAAAQPQRLDVDRGTWTVVGSPVAGIDMMDVHTVGLVTVVQTVPEGQSFCPPQLFEPAAGTAMGQQLQVSYDGGDYASLPDGTYGLGVNAAGTCAFFSDETQATLLDPESGEMLVLPGREVHVF
ncbi:MAG: hypothetical protein ACRBN8_11030 [Nannocystales bacterium]